MEQNTIAIIWDFDKTLIPGYMQEPIFQYYSIKEQDFWDETNSLVNIYKEQGIKVNEDTIYLNHMITCAQQGTFKGLNNEKLREFGGKLKFYPGVPEIFKTLKEIISKDEKYSLFGIHVEHYIVSTGLTEMIKGSGINDYVDGIWGCEFIENPQRSNLIIREDVKNDGEKVIQQIGYIVDNTSKTRAVFEINKGSNKIPDINVNSKMEKCDRRVPFENMIYIADGPSDVPVFSVIKQYGGRTFAIYPHGKEKQFKQVNNLARDGRIDLFAEADYSKDTTAYMWLTLNVKEIAERIYNNYYSNTVGKVGSVPKHISTE